MGAKLSVPERIHKAAKMNDIGELQALCADMRMNRALDPATKQAMLNWTDEEGRTALMHAAQKNHLHVAQMLLDEGADLHAIAPKRSNGGSALAEAVAGRHEALVELLLRYGADPFTENPAGKTPLDLALDARAVNILRACERKALFCGYVSTRVGQLKGFAYTSKDRWVVIAPRFTPPPPGGAVGEVRVMMLLFRNAAEGDPRTKLWLDGASISRSQGGEALLRLHPNHVQPRNIHCAYASGWTMFFQTARSQGLVPAGFQPQNPDAAFAAFLATASRPLEQLQQQQQLQLAAAAGNPWQQPGPAASILPTAGVTGGSAHSAPQQQQPYMHGGLQMQPAVSPPLASFQQQPQHLQQQQPGSDGAGLTAQPGETDEAFAQRLAALYGSSPAHSPTSSGRVSTASTAAPSAATSNAPSRLGSSTATTARPQAAADASNAFAAPDGPNPFVAAPGLLPQASDNPFTAHGATSGSTGAPQPPPLQQQQQLAPARESDGGAPSAPSAPAAGAPAAAVAAVSAAAAVDITGHSSSASLADVSDADLCVICLSAPREVGLLHGSTVHKCLCKECAPMVRAGQPCPLCRQVVERVLGVY